MGSSKFLVNQLKLKTCVFAHSTTSLFFICLLPLAFHKCMCAMPAWKWQWSMNGTVMYAFVCFPNWIIIYFCFDLSFQLFWIHLMAQPLLIEHNLAAGLVVSVVDPQPGESIIDCCAAPGGKTVFMATCLSGQGNLCSERSHFWLEVFVTSEAACKSSTVFL